MATVPVRKWRKSFSKIPSATEAPQLIELQRSSFKRFLQSSVLPEQREDSGLQGVFKSVFPIRAFNQSASLEFVSYTFDEPKYNENECRRRGLTYAVPVRILVRLVVWDIDESSGAQSIRDVKEQEVYFGEIPLMTDFGTFIVNGTERVIVNQLHRSPGVFFEHDKGKTHSSGKLLFSARMIPYRGAWLDFEFDARDILHVRIDRRRKMPATVLLRSLGYSEEELLNMFYKSESFTFEAKNKIFKGVVPEVLVYQRPTKDILDPSSGEVLVKKGRRYTKAVIQKISKIKNMTIPVEVEDMFDRVSAHDVVDPETGEVLLGANSVLTEKVFEELYKRNVRKIDLLYIDNLNVGPYLRNTLLSDKVTSPDEARMEIYRRLRPGDPVTIEAANAFFDNLFFNPERYDLSKVGRLKMNYKFGQDVPLEVCTLRKEDIVFTTNYLLKLKDGEGEVDDIDHLGNRRVRPVGELLENQYRVGLLRMERAIRERMSLQDVETLMPHDLVNPKPVSAAVREFFGSSQLSQFMDQTNPLSEITHKRRLSALGPGGLTRERAGFEVRDVHTTHYGRICPIETPEGPNIGLISSLALYAKVNDYGFIETPYRKVEGGRVLDEVVYKSALEEGDLAIAQASAPIDARGKFANQKVQCRQRGEFTLSDRDEVGLMDVSPQQLVSVSAALVPFLEHDDANRALMGANMMRQAVPLVKTESPLVGTDVEKIVAKDSGVTVVAKRDGVVVDVDAGKIIVKSDKVDKKTNTDADIYELVKYRRSNQSTCIVQKPIIKAGDKVRAGDVLADGPSTEGGELALGKNVLVAFMPWQGYNFEDSILVSQRLIKDDTFTSIHIEEFEVAARDTKLGKEEITRDIPNVGDEALMNMDESGVVVIGAEVKPGDILVGKVTPKGETQLSPEERLLRAIFGDKAGDVKDTSLRVSPGVSGVVIGAQVFSREGIELDDRAKEIIGKETQQIKKELDTEIRTIKDAAARRIRHLLIGRTTNARIMDAKGKNVVVAKGKMITNEILNRIPVDRWQDISVDIDEDTEAELADLFEDLQTQQAEVQESYDQRLNRLTQGDDLPPGVIKIIKVFVAIKRRLAVGDKMAGRHGNKGVISRIMAEEDMPYLPDGRPVDVVLNPLGVPSRMNVGQILEVHLGWAAHEMGQQINKILEDNYSKEALVKAIKKAYKNDKDVEDFLEKASEEKIRQYAKNVKNGIPIGTPVFDGANESEIKDLSKEAGLPENGQVILFDGRTGETFDNPVTVGMMYILKLHHLVDEKIHARSIGPYSLVTQQPLGGKAQFGGQRLGEMEVWALEAYGAAYALQEFLTVKSDDVVGRARMYEAIVKGEKILEPGLPESFKVLIKELQALGLDVELHEKEIAEEVKH